MSDRIEEIRARWAKATPGPWQWDGDPVQPDALCAHEAEVTIFEAVDNYNNAAMRWPNPKRVADQSAIAHAPDDIAYLLAELEQERKVVEAVRSSEDACAGCECVRGWMRRCSVHDVLAAYDRVTGEEASDAV